MKKFYVATALCLSILTTGVQAEGPSIYKDCGIGAMIFSGNESFNRPMASIVNVIWDWGTTASSSKSSGTCTRKGNEVAAAIFIHETYESVVEDTAKGAGDHLFALLDLMEVNTESRDSVISSIQTKLAVVVSDSHYRDLTRLEKAESYFNILDTTI